MTSNQEFQWAFGFGSNMNQAYVESVKGLKVHDRALAVLQGYKLSFRVYGMQYFEPSFANLTESEGDEVHGVLSKLSKEDAEKLVRMERTYERVERDFLTYDGQIIHGFFFQGLTAKLGPVDVACSQRYRDIIVKGAMEAGLRENYVAKLREIPVYSPSSEILEKRKMIPSWEALPEKSWSELPSTDDKSDSDGLAYYSVLGFVVERKRNTVFQSPNRDLTGPLTAFLHGEENSLIGLRGEEGSCLRIADMAEGDVEYLRRFLDFLLHGDLGWDQTAESTITAGEIPTRGRIIAFLREFKSKQSI